MSAPVAPFGFPETITSVACQVSVKTRKLSDGRFEAVASIFFMGRRGLTVYYVADSRSRAARQAEKATETSRDLRAALRSGHASYSQAVAS